MTQHLELTTRVVAEQYWPADAMPGPARRATKSAARGTIATAA